ncbi:MAG: hypothetical protein PF572_00315 [Patescibacteria group bacterium]|nr:hypothetical protein [Patescibacteria group bacterium]
MWGQVNSLNDWKRIVDAQHACDCEMNSTELMKMAKSTVETSAIFLGGENPPEDHLPNFGLRREHIALTTLEEWARKNDMYELLISV